MWIHDCKPFGWNMFWMCILVFCCKDLKILSCNPWQFGKMLWTWKGLIKITLHVAHLYLSLPFRTSGATNKARQSWISSCHLFEALNLNPFSLGRGNERSRNGSKQWELLLQTEHSMVLWSWPGFRKNEVYHNSNVSNVYFSHLHPIQISFETCLFFTC